MIDHLCPFLRILLLAFLAVAASSCDGGNSVRSNTAAQQNPSTDSAGQDSGTQDNDSDGYPNSSDNCPIVSNSDQADDGNGDACETNNQPPVAQISSSASSGSAPFQIAFNASGSFDPDGSIVTVSWDFGDGISANGENVSHNFTNPGSYNTVLTVTDNDGASASAVISINVISASLQTYTLNVSVSSSHDDVEEQDGQINLLSSDLEMAFEGSNAQTVGLRFQDITIPTGAIISSAYIQFTAHESHSGPSSLTLRGEKNANSATFGTDDFNVTNRSRTSASVTWAPAAWTGGDAGTAQRTPDISNLVQEIISQSNWSPNNSLSFLIYGSGTRVADSYDGNSSSAPVLRIEYQSRTPPPTIRITRGPYLQLGTSSSMMIRWRTDRAGDSTILYGTDSTNLNLLRSESGSRTEHEVNLTDLAANTRYYYAVQTNGENLTSNASDSWFKTNPVVGTTEPFRVWVLGDPGTADSSQLSVYNAYKRFADGAHTDLWLMLGDNAYPDGTDAEYQRAMYDVYPDLLARSVVWPTLGNHDAYSASSSTQSGVYFDIFSLPVNGEAGGQPSGTEAYYSFDYGNVHFICLNSQDVDRDINGAMMNWLRDDLDNNDSTWTVAYWHHPPYSKGSHDSDVAGRLIDMRETALPILESRGVDLVLSGHSHSYERSYLIDGHYDDSSTLIESMILDNGDGSPARDGAYRKQFPNMANDGAVYSVVGSSGLVRSAPLDHPIMIYSEARLGSMILDFNNRTMTARFLDSSGAVKDDFTIEK